MRPEMTVDEFKNNTVNSDKEAQSSDEDIDSSDDNRRGNTESKAARSAIKQADMFSDEDLEDLNDNDSIDSSTMMFHPNVITVSK